MSGFEGEDRLYMVSDILATGYVVTTIPAKKVKTAVTRNMKLEDLRIMALGKYILSLDDKKKSWENAEAYLYVQMRLVRGPLGVKLEKLKRM